ncbi:MAG: site-specific integrase [Phycisphaerales bacterium]|nr:site-specific integrase [Phycisphaerales bacterium]
MATIVTYGDGLRRIEFSFIANGPRKIIRLGRISKKQAEGWLAKIEAILADRQQRRPHDPEVSNWLAQVGEGMLKRFRAVGLAEGVGLADVTLRAFLDDYFARMPGKQSTRTFYGHTRRNLTDFFTESRMMRTITEKDADAWRRWLVDDEKLAPATVARRVKAARTLFTKAKKWKVAEENPFAELKAGSQVNDTRKRFIPAADIDKVIDQCPDLEWRVIVALSRYGGLRTPSETFALRWEDINWEDGKILIHSPKMEHRENFATRIIPLFEEIEPHLLSLFNEAEEGSEYVISRNRLISKNLRTRFEKIIKRAGLVAWPKLFHNLRASRETELMKDYDLKTVCQWIGNSPEIAARHYAMSQDLDADFQRATGRTNKAQQKAQQTAAGRACHDVTSPSVDVPETTENKAKVANSQRMSISDNEAGWAMRDSNIGPISREKRCVCERAVHIPVQLFSCVSNSAIFDGNSR